MNDFIETNCCIELGGKSHCANGAYINGDRALVYITSKGVTDWQGNVLGSYEVIGQWKQYPPRSYVPIPYTMTAVRVTLNDGSEWYGRYSSDWAQACRLRRRKGT